MSSSSINQSKTILNVVFIPTNNSNQSERSISGHVIKKSSKSDWSPLVYSITPKITTHVLSIKELRIEFLKPYIVATWWCKPLILQILIILSIKYEVWIILGFKEIGMRKLEFVARTQFLWHVSVSSFFSNPIYIQRAEPSKYFKKPGMKTENSLKS